MYAFSSQQKAGPALLTLASWPAYDGVSDRPTSDEEVSVDFWRIVAAIILPPLGVFLQVGIGKQFWINILLTILGYIPGIVHAVWVIAKY
jgi:uncharacterized membrane protein YqaE (UPF0057 family)